MKYVHTNIVCRDVQKLSRFYEQVFGCKQVRPESQLSGDWLDRGTGITNAKIKSMELLLPGYDNDGPTIEMFEYSEIKDNHSMPSVNSKGYGHIAFKTDDVKKVSENVVKNGGKKMGEFVEKEFKSGTLTYAYVADPEDNIIEIQSWTPKH